MTPDEIRAEFERWAPSVGLILQRYQLDHPAEEIAGTYRSPRTHAAWLAYSAAHAAAERRYGPTVATLETIARLPMWQNIVAAKELAEAALAALKGEK